GDRLHRLAGSNVESAVNRLHHCMNVDRPKEIPHDSCLKSKKYNGSRNRHSCRPPQPGFKSGSSGERHRILQFKNSVSVPRTPTLTPWFLAKVGEHFAARYALVDMVFEQESARKGEVRRHICGNQRLEVLTTGNPLQAGGGGSRMGHDLRILGVK